MSYDLKVLEENRKELLLAEVGALLHNLGKLGQAFLQFQISKATDGALYKDFGEYSYRLIVGLIEDYERSLSNPSSSLQSKAKASRDCTATSTFLSQDDKDWLKAVRFNLPEPLKRSLDYCLGDFIELQQEGWYVPDKRNNIPIIELFSEGSIVTELLELAHDSASGGEKEGQAAKSAQYGLPIFSSTVFGHEEPVPFDSLEDFRTRFLIALKAYVSFLHTANASYLQFAEKRREMMQTIKPLLIEMVADTQRPINDVMLWDISTSVAALLKAALAQSILQITSRPSRGTMQWRVLSISFDGPSFLEQSHHVTDLSGRQQAINSALDEVRDLLEVRYPIGNEIYRDECGSLFAVSDFIQLNGRDLLALTNAEGENLEHLIHKTFMKTSTHNNSQRKDLYGDIEPAIELSRPFSGKKIDLTKILKSRPLPNRPNLEHFSEWWSSSSSEKKDICSVCGLRPQGFGAPDSYYAKKAESRKVCYICLDRRQQRSENWMTNKVARKSTIWIDEVADNHGYAALVIGRFDLSHWLDGTEIEREGRPASFARLQRVWRTTQEFWQDISYPNSADRHSIHTWIGHYLPSQFRLQIEPDNPEALSALGKFHVYEAEWKEKRFSVVWNPIEHYFLTAENLEYLTKQPIFKSLKGLTDKLRGEEIQLFEPSGYGRSSKLKETFKIKQVNNFPQNLFKPFIPLTDTPETFMALVPADKAIKIATAIKAKYLCEMGRVQSRLPLALGLVYFGRRTPLRAVLNAGRRMLKMPLTSGSRFDFEFLDTTARRYEVHYAPENRRQSTNKRHRPYPLEALDELEVVWTILKSSLTTSQMRALEGLIEAKREEWNADFTDSTFVQFVRDVLDNADWHKRKPANTDMEILVRAALSSMLSDVLEIHFSIIKEAEVDQRKIIEEAAL